MPRLRSKGLPDFFGQALLVILNKKREWFCANAIFKMIKRKNCDKCNVESVTNGTT